MGLSSLEKEAKSEPIVTKIWRHDPHTAFAAVVYCLCPHPHSSIRLETIAIAELKFA